MSSNTESFAPIYGTGVVVAPGVASAFSTLPIESQGVVIGTQVATTADYPVLPSTQVSLSKALKDQTVAYIAPAGGGSIHIIAGRGV
jgi:hypothetical protein